MIDQNDLTTDFEYMPDFIQNDVIVKSIKEEIE